jgi:hypothetical protein
LHTPSLPDPEIDHLESFIRLPKAWLEECDHQHKDLCAPRYDGRVLPKRLINVENPKRPRIVETTDVGLDASATLYIALSHKWGQPEKFKSAERPNAYMPEKAKSTPGNIEQRKRRVPSRELPLSFRNAIAITAALDCKYLWIDSLCILQGPDGDFNEQADKMQSTFSNAYCVLAACSAEGAEEGFLQHRKPRCVKIGDIFVSAVTDDFVRDVLQSPLNSRGWVLQERALARRTIFFSNMQMYWECGDGVRCETLTRFKK